VHVSPIHMHLQTVQHVGNTNSMHALPCIHYLAYTTLHTLPYNGYLTTYSADILFWSVVCAGIGIA
jgi:hypothetical protein